MSQITSIHGRRLGLAHQGHLVAKDTTKVTSPAVGATITVSAEAATTADTRDCVVTLLDANGLAIDYVETVEVFMLLDAAQAAFVATGGSTGISLGAAGNGALLAIVAKKYFLCMTEATGILDLDWLDTGTEVAFMAVRLPNGTVVVSDALTNA